MNHLIKNKRTERKEGKKMPYKYFNVEILCVQEILFNFVYSNALYHILDLDSGIHSFKKLHINDSFHAFQSSGS